MNAAELFANTLSAGDSSASELCVYAIYSTVFLAISLDASTRDDATRKLETASQENFVWFPPFAHVR